jgi:flavodoxin
MMKTLIVFDSMYGNTEKIARAIGDVIAGDVKALRVTEASPSDLKSISLLVVGSPTQGFMPTKLVQAFLKSIPDNALNNIGVAAFDTRMPEAEVGRGLRFIMKVGGYAAPRIASTLKKKGGNQVVPPEGFLVNDKEGPLIEGELERAGSWAKGILEGIK